MEQLELAVEKRSILGKKVKSLRRKGIIPAVIYGQGMESMAVQVQERELERVLRRAGSTHLINLAIGDGERKTVLVREVQRDPITDRLIHVDFYAVKMTERIYSEVPLVLVGESPAVRSGEGMLIYGVDKVEVECLPADLPESIQVDLSGLEAVDQAIYVRDLLKPKGVEILTDPDELVVKVAPVVEEVEEEVPVEEEAEVEVVAKGKKVEEEEEEKEEEE